MEKELDEILRRYAMGCFSCKSHDFVNGRFYCGGSDVTQVITYDRTRTRNRTSSEIFTKLCSKGGHCNGYRQR